MTRRIPTHLEHLDTWRGLPVPTINLRDHGDEPTPDRWHLVDHPYRPGVKAFAVDDVPGAPPNFKAKALQRQRAAVEEGRCQVCWLYLDWPDRRLAVHGGDLERPQVDDRRALVVTEPWLCPNCAEFARDTCPALIRANTKDQLFILEGLTPRTTRLVESRGWCDSFGPDVLAAMWSKIELLVRE